MRYICEKENRIWKKANPMQNAGIPLSPPFSLFILMFEIPYFKISS